MKSTRCRPTSAATRSSALLEVLDPEQNHTFNDHYLDLDYDLSKVMFICTANSMHTIPGPLQDRMEVIRIAGYTEDEKMAIARKYLVPKTREANGLADVNVKVTNTAIRTLIKPLHVRVGRSQRSEARAGVGLRASWRATCSRTASATSCSTASAR